MNNYISILGTGWLGLPLSEFFIKKKYNVKGSTTSEDKISLLQKKKIRGYLIKAEEKGPKGNIKGFLSESETLIINIPPGLRSNPNSNFVSKIKNLIPYIANSGIQKVLFISSTSVFADHIDFPIIT